MSNDPVGRKITTKLNPYWKNHPGQRDAVHGTYHLGAAGAQVGAYSALPLPLKVAVGQKLIKGAKKDLKRCHDHWVKGENRNDRVHYNKSPRRKKKK